MDEAILDTDILSEVLKQKDQQVLVHAKQYLAEHGRFAYSAITVYEIVRGMRAVRASKQLRTFQSAVETSDVFPISLAVLIRAAELWAEGRNNGHPHNDADLIVAATALEAKRLLVTGNTAHYSWITGLQLSDWREATA